MPTPQEQLESAISAVEAQRSVLGDSVVEASVRALRAQLAAMASPGSPEPVQVLKQVTILFLDVVGSTSLGQRLDPEAIGDVMDGALRRLTALVERHRGKVLQYAGDSLLAVFGADAAHEDDAECAVRCGLALVALGRELGAEVQRALGHAGFDVRVGIHTGDVLLGGGVDAEGAIRGSAVNIAARMEQAAPPGRLRISHDTHALVRGLFEVEAQPPLAVKGIDEPVCSYLVAAATTRGFLDAGRGLDGVSTRMVGRSAELSALQDVFRTMLARQGGEARAAVVTVVGDAGIGKSRLLREFDAWMQARRDAIHLFRGRATPQMQYQPFGLLRDILVRRFQITDGDGTEVALGKLEAAIVPLFLGDDGAELAEGHAHVLAHLVGIDTASRHLGGVRDNAKQLRNRAFHVGAQLLRRLVSRDGRPAVLELEDLHWADNETLDFLDYVAAVDRDVALLVLASTRPQLFERRSDWTGSERVHLRVDLAPLDKTGSRMLADELLQKLPDVPSVLRELVTGGAEGNPFYMEELVRMLVDQGAIQTGPAWTLNAERLLVTRVPPTLSGVLQARLDGLPADERSTLQAASVIGPVFWEKALLAIDSRAARTLPSLVARGLVLRQGDAAPEGLHDHAFRHQLLQQVAYDTLLKRPRRELHGKVARWLAEGHDARGSGDLLGITADHFERAGDRANATEFHARAAAHAAGRMAHEAVAMHVDRALALLAGNDDPEVRWRLLVARNESLGSQGRRDEQAVTQEAMEALAAALGDDRKRARALLRRSGRAMEMSDLREQESAALDAIACAERAGDDESRLHAMRHLANARVSRGDLATGEALLQEVLVETRRLGFRHVEALTLNTLSVVADARGDATELLALTRQILAICQDTGDLRGEMASLGNLGTAWLSLGQLAEARRWAEQALRTVRAYGERFLEVNPLCTLSSVAHHGGEGAKALSFAHAALGVAEAAKARSWAAFALLRVGDAELLLERWPEAHGAFARARTLSLEIDDVHQHDAAAGLARVALAQGDRQAAIEAVQPVLDHVAGGGTLEGADARLVEWTLHCVFAGLDDPRAGEWLARAHAALEEQAGRITAPDLRHAFLSNLPHHRAIEAAWAGASSDGSASRSA